MCNSQIILGTETWLNSDVPSELLLDSDFSIYRKDRTHRRGGGVLIAIKGLESAAVTVTTNLELLWVEIKISFQKFVLGVCYRPPNSGRDFVDELGTSLEEVFLTYPDNIIILAGDFNFPGINWADSSVVPSCSNPLECLEFMHLLSAFGLHQQIAQSTRGDSTLDLFFITHPEHISSIHFLSPISDHSHQSFTKGTRQREDLENHLGLPQGKYRGSEFRSPPGIRRLRKLLQ